MSRSLLLLIFVTIGQLNLLAPPPDEKREPQKDVSAGATLPPIAGAAAPEPEGPATSLGVVGRSGAIVGPTPEGMARVRDRINAAVAADRVQRAAEQEGQRIAGNAVDIGDAYVSAARKDPANRLEALVMPTGLATEGVLASRPAPVSVSQLGTPTGSDQGRMATPSTSASIQEARERGLQIPPGVVTRLSDGQVYKTHRVELASAAPTVAPIAVGAGTTRLGLPAVVPGAAVVSGAGGNAPSPRPSTAPSTPSPREARSEALAAAVRAETQANPLARRLVATGSEPSTVAEHQAGLAQIAGLKGTLRDLRAANAARAATRGRAGAAGPLRGTLTVAQATAAAGTPAEAQPAPAPVLAVGGRSRSEGFVLPPTEEASGSRPGRAPEPAPVLAVGGRSRSVVVGGRADAEVADPHGHVGALPPVVGAPARALRPGVPRAAWAAAAAADDQGAVVRPGRAGTTASRASTPAPGSRKKPEGKK